MYSICSRQNLLLLWVLTGFPGNYDASVEGEVGGETHFEASGATGGQSLIFVSRGDYNAWAPTS